LYSLRISVESEYFTAINMPSVDKSVTASDKVVNWEDIPFPPSTVIETPRLSLRPLHIKDAPQMAELCDDEAVAQWLSNRCPFPYKLSDAEWFIGKNGVPPAEGMPWITLVITVKENSNELMGCIGLHPGSDTYCRGAEIGTV
jgi:[ribosomal protein S5]-alanine N-acetyltransferase